MKLAQVWEMPQERMAARLTCVEIGSRQHILRRPQLLTSSPAGTKIPFGA